MLSAQLSWSSDQKKAMPMELKVWSISSAKYSLNQKSAIPRFRNYYKRSSSLPGSSDTIFDEYKVIVVTDFPLADILHNRDATRRISKWAVELGALKIKFQPKTAIKSQALVDFLAEWWENQISAPVDRPKHWIMYFDGSLKLGGGNAGVLFISPKGEELKYVFQILFPVSNNEAEYEALLHGLRLAISLGIKRLLVYGDSLRVVQQVNKEWDINKETMYAYVAEIRKLENKFSGLEIHHVIHDNSVGADALSKLGSERANVPPGVFVHELHHPSVNLSGQTTTDSTTTATSQEVKMVEEDWRTLFIDFIKEFKLPPGVELDNTEAARIVRYSKGYAVVGDSLYKRSASEILMKCVSTEKGRTILREIHDGSCGNHAASRTLVGKAYRSRFF